MHAFVRSGTFDQGVPGSLVGGDVVNQEARDGTLRFLGDAGVKWRTHPTTSRASATSLRGSAEAPWSLRVHSFGRGRGGDAYRPRREAFTLADPFLLSYACCAQAADR